MDRNQASTDVLLDGKQQTDRNRSVAFFLRALNAGGAQRISINLANGLADSGWDVDVVVAHFQGELSGQLAEDINIVDLGTPHVPILGVGASLPGLARYLRNERPPVLFSAMTYVNVVAIPATILAGGDTAVIPTEHTTFGMQDDPKERLVASLASVLYPLADRIVAVSSGVKESVLAGTRASSGQLSVIYNPVVTSDLREKAATEPEHPWLGGEHETILSVGRLEPEKDYETLLRAFTRLYQNRLTAKLIILGDGSLRSDLERLAKRLDIDDVVSFAGFVDNPYGFMRLSDVYVLSSRREGLPTALVEAMACGCPVVATDCPSGPREILQDGRLGPLVPVGDEEALTDAISSALDSPPDSSELRERADMFSIDPVVAEYESLIDELNADANVTAQDTLL